MDRLLYIHTIILALCIAVEAQGSTHCQFPFIYKGISYSACTAEDDPDGKLWCSTRTDHNGIHVQGYWKHCTTNVVPISTDTGLSTGLALASAFECPRQNGYFKHEDPTNCEEFHECVDGISTLHKCPEGLKFDEFLGYCDLAFSGYRQGCVDKIAEVCPNQNFIRKHVCGYCTGEHADSLALAFTINERGDPPPADVPANDVFVPPIKYYGPTQAGKCLMELPVQTFHCTLNEETRKWKECHSVGKCKAQSDATTGHLIKGSISGADCTIVNPG